MSDHIKNILLMRMQIAWFCFFSVVSLGAAINTALTGTQWSSTDNQTRLMIAIGVFVTWGTTMMALFSKAMSRVADGSQPFAEDTTTTQKTTTATVQTTETKTLPQDTAKPPTQSP